MLSCIHNDRIGEFGNYPTAQEVWNQLKIAYGVTSIIRLRSLTLKFEKYVLDHKHTIAEHLRRYLTGFMT